MRRTGVRLLALVALAAWAVALAVVLLGQGGKGGKGAGAAALPRAKRVTPKRAPPPDESRLVRNATPQPDWRPHPGPVPIFRFHVVGEPPPGETAPELFVSPEDFRAQMDWLEAHGYEAVGLETVLRAWTEGGTLPQHPVVLSFDGIEGDLASVVLPDLRRRGWPGVLVFDSDGGAIDRKPLNRLLAAGWELEAEAAEPGGKAGEGGILEAILRVPVHIYAFPQGEYDEAIEPAVEAAGYEGATATGGGFAESDSLFDMPRITIFGLSGVEGFAEAMRSRGEGVGA